MTSLSLNDKAYNAAVDALNDAEERLDKVLTERNRAWDAAQALCPIGKHGRRGSGYDEVEVVYERS
jgi:hypothetical protein